MKYCQFYTPRDRFSCQKGDSCKNIHAETEEDFKAARQIMCQHGYEFECRKIVPNCPYHHPTPPRYVLDLQRMNTTPKNLFKTKFCCYFDATGTCPKGDMCTFAHGREDLRPKECQFGNECKFYHIQSVCTSMHVSENNKMYQERSINQGFSPTGVLCRFENNGKLCRIFHNLECGYLHPGETKITYDARTKGNKLSQVKYSNNDFKDYFSDHTIFSSEENSDASDYDLESSMPNLIEIFPKERTISVSEEK